MSSHEELNKVFGIAPEQPIVEVSEKPKVQSDNPDMKDDYELARETLRNMVEKGNEALDDMMAVAKGSEHPRAFEVTSTLINTIAHAAKDLIALQKTMKEINKPAVGEEAPKTINNNHIVFQGSTKDLIKQVMEAKNNKVIDI